MGNIWQGSKIGKEDTWQVIKIHWTFLRQIIQYGNKHKLRKRNYRNSSGWAATSTDISTWELSVSGSNLNPSTDDGIGIITQQLSPQIYGSHFLILKLNHHFKILLTDIMNYVTFIKKYT